MVEALYLGIQGRALYAPLTLVANDVISSKCEHIGLKLDPNDPEYSIWVMLQNRGFAGHLSHFQVDNESARTTVTATVPCAVIVTTKNVTATLTNMFPYEFDYGSVIAHKHASTRTFWSEPASRWAELATSDSLDQNLRVLPRDPQNLAFDKNTINLRLRSPRAGTLHLVGLVTDARGKPIGEKTLRITADADFEQTLPLQGEPLSAAIPSTGGGCKITLTLTDPAFTNAFGPRLEGFQWRWETAGDRSPGGP